MLTNLIDWRHDEWEEDIGMTRKRKIRKVLERDGIEIEWNDVVDEIKKEIYTRTGRICK